MKRFLEALLAVIVLVLTETPARAEDPKRVIVIVAPENDVALDAVVRERVAAAGASITLEHAHSIDPLRALASPTLPPAFAHVWIDFTGPRAVFVLLDGRVERGLIRHATRDRGDEIAREEIGHVLQTAIEALLAGNTIGIGREDLLPKSRATPAPKPVPRDLEPDPKISEPERWHVRSGGLYAIDAFGAGTAIHGPGATFDVLHRFGDFSLGVRVLGQARFPAEITVAPFTLLLESWASRASALGIVRVGAWSIEGALGAGADIEHVVPILAGPGARLARSTVRASPLVRASLGLAFGTPRVAIDFTLDIGLASERFETDAGGARTTLFSANAVRPGVMLEIGTP